MEPNNHNPVYQVLSKWLLFFTIIIVIAGISLIIVNCQRYQNAKVPKDRTVHFETDYTVDSFVYKYNIKPNYLINKPKISEPYINYNEDTQIDYNDNPSTEYSKNFTVPSIDKIIMNPGDDKTPLTDDIYYKADEMPMFNGGNYEMFKDWIAENVQYPDIAAENGISGRVVIQCSVNSMGNICDVTVVKSVDPSLDQEAIRVISASPKWIPGKIKGQPVKVQFNFTVYFILK